ncbi:adenylate kinase [Candidatus Bathyarchaeota archaeon]|nr:MAG: adenylate kinase [Candidatus Bathyarchaeota archaeon]
MSEVYIVVGLSGVGKSSVIEYALSKKPEVVRVNFGDAVLDEAMKMNLVKSRDELRLLDAEVQRDLQLRAARRIGNMEGKIVVDTHMTIPGPDGYLPGLPMDVLQELKPKKIIIIWAKPHEVLKRRLLDKTRTRVDEDMDEIGEHMDFDRAASMAIAVHLGIPVKPIENDIVERAGQELAEALD